MCFHMRLQNIALRALLKARTNEFLVVMDRQKNKPGRNPEFPKRSSGFDAIHYRHSDVHYNHVRLQANGFRYQLLPVRHCANDFVSSAQDLRHALQQSRMIIGE